MAVRKRLGELLLEAGVIDGSQLQAALGHQRKWGGRLGQALVDLRLVSEDRIVEALSRKFGYEVVRTGALQAGAALDSALKLLPREFASRHNLLPFATDTSSVSVAMADPANIAVVDEIRFRTGRKVKIALAGDREIAEAVRRHYYAGDDRVEAIDLEFEGGDAPVEAVAAQFGGGSTEALDDFFSRAPAAPTTPQPDAAPSAAPPAPARPLAQPRMLDLEELLPGAPPAGAPVPPRPPPAPAGSPPPAPPAPQAGPEDAAERTGTLDLPLDAEIPPEAGGAEGPPAPAAAPAAPSPPEADAGETREPALAVLEAVDQIAHGGAVGPDLVKPSQLAATLVRLLIRKKVITVEDLVEEFGRR
jgi:type IV pilus assembly protein PilB